MGRWTGLVAAFGCWAVANADVVFSLEAFTAGGQPISGEVAPGTVVTVDILLSADAEDAPVPDTRFIQLDFRNTDTAIQLDALTWAVDGDVYASFGELPFPSVVTVFLASSPLLLTLSEEPVKVADLELTVLGTGTLDIVDTSNIDSNAGGDVRAGFQAGRIFHRSMGNLQGGTMAFRVPGGGDPTPTDPDDDGGDDPVDDDDGDPDEPDGGSNDNDGQDDDSGNGNDNGNDNDNGNENDNSNANDNSNDNNSGDGGSGAGAPRACGAGMLGSGLFLLLSLGLMSFGARRRVN
jgi:hypothetical protein